MFAKKHFVITRPLLLALLGAMLLTAACSPTSAAPARVATPAPVATSAPTATTAAAEAALPAGDGMPEISLDAGSIASGFQTETVPAVATGADVPYWELLPAHIRVTLEGYPISDHFMQPQLFIYPVNALQEANAGAGQIVASLQTLIQAPQEITPMPFLPLVNAAQVMHTQLQYLDFQNGQGLRYLTQYDQGILPINNRELIYTYQGLTADDQYYVAAVLPVHHPSLPADEAVTGDEPPEFAGDFSAYLADVAATLNTEAGNTFTPDLTQLDAMLSSLEIR